MLSTLILDSTVKPYTLGHVVGRFALVSDSATLAGPEETAEQAPLRIGNAGGSYAMADGALVVTVSRSTTGIHDGGL